MVALMRGRDGADLWVTDMIATLMDMPNVRLMPRTTVTGAYDQGTYGVLERVGLHTADRNGPRECFWRITAKRSILCAGALERPIAFPNNDRPGIMMASAVRSYLNRWGVLFRGILEREMLAPPWRVLLRVLRRMELRGSVRGGRFVAGVGGEQFAFQESVDGLRKKAKSLQAEGSNQPVYHSLAASDPLNLLNLIMPKRKLAKLLNNRVLFEDGIPIAVIDAGEVKFLRDVSPERKWALQQALVQKHFPPRLRSYLGAGKATLR